MMQATDLSPFVHVDHGLLPRPTVRPELAMQHGKWWAAEQGVLSRAVIGG